MSLNAAGLVERQRWSAQDLGFPAHATLRAIEPSGEPSGETVAVGGDYGMVLIKGDAVCGFPFPEGARREMRSVTGMAQVGGVLHVATERGSFELREGKARGRGFPADGTGGFDDLRAVFAGPDGLIRAWRSHLEGAEGPGECISYAQGWGGRGFVGTLGGGLVELGVGELRRFEARQRPQPVRVLCMSAGCLWVAAAGELHRWDGALWQSQGPEPYALASQRGERLWSLARGALWRSDHGRWPEKLPLSLTRPWQLRVVGQSLWVGCKGALVVFDLPPLIP